jgi:hypothetical protein
MRNFEQVQFLSNFSMTIPYSSGIRPSAFIDSINRGGAEEKSQQRPQHPQYYKSPLRNQKLPKVTNLLFQRFSHPKTHFGRKIN